MIATPTTTVTVLGGTETGPYDDPAESNTEVATGIPASIIEGRQIVATEADQQARVIRYYTGRLPHGTTVDDSQRIRDERTGDVYSIDNVTAPVNPIIPQDVRLDLRRITG